MRNHLRFPDFSTSRRAPALLVLLGACAAAYGLYAAPQRAWPNLLLDGFYLVSLAVSALFFLAAQRLTGARWSAGLRRIPEAFASAMPAGAALLLAVWWGRHSLYPWSRALGLQTAALETAHSLTGRARYLQPSWVLARMAVVLLLWMAFAWLFRRASLAQDRNPRRSLFYHYRLNRYAAAFAVVFALSFTVGAYDWIVSLDPSWFSTMFAIYVFAGAFVQGIAAITLAVVLLKARGFLGEAAGKQQLQDLGKLLFAFSTFWAYIWICQYLLIWYGNIPEEITHYVKRTSGPWLIFFGLNFVLNWVVPFLALLGARAKSNPGLLKLVSVVLLCGHWLDLYLLIMPSVGSAPRIGFLEIALAAGYAGLLVLLFTRGLAQAPLVPVNDPVLAADAPDLHKIHILRWAPSGPREAGVEE